MTNEKKESARLLFLILTALFVTSLVTCNLIFLKFFSFNLPFTDFTFTQSVGLLPYPFTFLITDIISEVYGRKRANQVVIVGLFSSLFMLVIIFFAGHFPAAKESPVSDAVFNNVFGLAYIGVFASMSAYLAAQYVDIQIFHFWKKKTKGKHLWLRNNASTFGSQIIDTLFIVGILVYFGKLDAFEPYLSNGIIYKICFAIIDTPIVYIILYFIRKNFKLSFGEEIKDI